MSAVTVNVVVGQPADCSILRLWRLQSSSCQLLFLSHPSDNEACSRSQQTGDVVGSPMS